MLKLLMSNLSRTRKLQAMIFQLCLWSS